MADACRTDAGICDMTWKDHKREAAIAAGQTVFEGKPCTRGHGSARYVYSSKCVVCMRLIQRKWRLNHQDHIVRYRANNKRRHNEQQRLRHSLAPALTKDCLFCSHTFTTLPGCGRNVGYCSSACRSSAKLQKGRTPSVKQAHILTTKRWHEANPAAMRLYYTTDYQISKLLREAAQLDTDLTAYWRETSDTTL